MKSFAASWSLDGFDQRGSLDRAAVYFAATPLHGSDVPPTAPRPLDISLHGSAVRCLERLAGGSGCDTGSARFPTRATLPGEQEFAALGELAEALNLAAGIEQTRDYDRLLCVHERGNAVLVVTDHARKNAGSLRSRRTTSLLVAADRSGFHLWWPDPAGLGEHLPRAPRSCWSRWQALALILQPGRKPPTDIPEPAPESGAA